MGTKKVLLLLGGTYHDFEGFSKTIVPAATELSSSLEVTYDPHVLLRLNETGIGAVVMYTCLGDSKQGDIVGKELTQEQADSLVTFVRNGGGLLGVHGATVISDANQDLINLFGAQFHTHPAPFTFTVTPRPESHPMIEDIEPFEVHDEFYLHHCRKGIEVLMTAEHEGKTHPMVWTRTEGRGKAAYIAMGHDAKVWSLPPYMQLIHQALGWLTG